VVKLASVRPSMSTLASLSQAALMDTLSLPTGLQQGTAGQGRVGQGGA
jgi:hypothetical protein